MVTGSVRVTNGQNINTGTPIGTMGATGNVTGPHLHLECSTGIAWQCGTFLNPCDILGIPNVVGTVVQYDGTTPPPPVATEWIYKTTANNQSEMENNALMVINFYRRARNGRQSNCSEYLATCKLSQQYSRDLQRLGGGGGYRTCPVDP